MLALLNPLNKPLLIAVISVTSGAWAGWYFNGLRYETEISNLVEANVTAALEAANTALIESTKLQEKKDNAIQQANKRAKINATAADNANIELNRLRDTAEALSASARNADETNNQRIDALSTLLGNCATEYTSLGKTADQHASDAQTLSDAWPR